MIEWPGVPMTPRDFEDALRNAMAGRVLTDVGASRRLDDALAAIGSATEVTTAMIDEAHAAFAEQSNPPKPRA